MKHLLISFDGGGTKGLYAGILLDYLETHVNAKMGCNLAQLLRERYDMITIIGTSVGGILASCIYNKMVKTEALMLEPIISDFLTTVFSKRKLAIGVYGKYKNTGLKTCIEKYCNPVITEESKIHLVVPSYCVTKGDFVIKSSFSIHSISKYNSIPWLDQILGSCAAPTFFDPVLTFNQQGERITLIDGGLVLNNPGMMGFSELINHVSVDIDRDAITIISLGVTQKEDHHYVGILDLIKNIISASTNTKVEDYYIKSLNKLSNNIKVIDCKNYEAGDYPLDCQSAVFINDMRKAAYNMLPYLIGELNI